MAFGYEGELIRLVPFDYERHFENCYHWINDPEVNRWLLADGPMTRLAEEEWFKSASAAGGSDIHFAVETLDGEHIGNSGLHGINTRHGFCNTGSLIGRRDLWGKGYGTDSTRTRARYIFEVLGLRVAFSSFLEGNERSLRMQQKAGYEIYGTAPKKYWRAGAFHDEILTVLTRERWEAMQVRHDHQ